MGLRLRYAAPMKSCGILLTCALLVSCRQLSEAIGFTPPPESPETTPESTNWAKTSTTDEVAAFVAALAEQPYGARIASRKCGTTNQGRSLQLVAVANPMPDLIDDLGSSEKLRILVAANIHGGEVEGKEAVQILLREFAEGDHGGLLDDLVVLFVPVYNADGNDKIDRTNRVTQNGPDDGVGERSNAQGLDLNRDFIKVESPECAALMELFRTFDPHVFMDLHTTNGSAHGYELTYAPSLSTNIDTQIDALGRGRLIPEIREAMLSGHGYRVFDYGNFTRGEERRWVTYDHRPRFGTNYYSLRNRIAVLSEAYSYEDFETRVRVTRAFVLETLRAAARNADAVQAVCAAADERVSTGSVSFGWKSELAPPVVGEVLVGAYDEIELPNGSGTRRIARPGSEPESMGIQVGFVSREVCGLPVGWAVLDPTPAVVRNLAAHGVQFSQRMESVSVLATRFLPRDVIYSEREFQAHHEVSLAGDWARAETIELPAGTLFVPARQPLGRLAAQLLEPESEDSLATWNFFDQAIRPTTDDGEGSYPVLRLQRLGDLSP